jgi:hypothetical protein
MHTLGSMTRGRSEFHPRIGLPLGFTASPTASAGAGPPGWRAPDDLGARHRRAADSYAQYTARPTMCLSGPDAKAASGTHPAMIPTITRAQPHECRSGIRCRPVGRLTRGNMDRRIDRRWPSRRRYQRPDRRSVLMAAIPSCRRRRVVSCDGLPPRTGGHHLLGPGSGALRQSASAGPAWSSAAARHCVSWFGHSTSPCPDPVSQGRQPYRAAPIDNHTGCRACRVRCHRLSPQATRMC